MTTRLLLLILSSVALSALAQLLLKIGVGGASSGAVSLPWHARMAAMLMSPHVLGGLLLYGIGTLIWLFVLARAPLSIAYPFVGLGFIMTAAMGAMVLGEAVTPLRMFGVLLIAIGCVLVARSA
jgi:multidrug transporter EmrE-like cation transporter